jgi:hypothetical protein
VNPNRLAVVDNSVTVDGSVEPRTVEEVDLSSWLDVDCSLLVSRLVRQLGSMCSLRRSRAINVETLIVVFFRRNGGAALWAIVALCIIRILPVLEAVPAEDVPAVIERDWGMLCAEVLSTYGALVVGIVRSWFVR